MRQGSTNEFKLVYDNVRLASNLSTLKLALILNSCRE